MIEHSEKYTEIVKALHAIQQKIHGVVKDSKNPHFRSSYASLESVIDTIREPLNKAGVTFLQAPGKCVDGTLEVTTAFYHTSGEWLRSTLCIPLAKVDPQGAGSAITYACRYSLMALLGLPPVEDDDGNAATRQTRNVIVPPLDKTAYKPKEASPEEAAKIREAVEAKAAFIRLCEQAIESEPDPETLPQWWLADAHQADLKKYGLNIGEINRLKAMINDCRNKAA